MQPLRENDAASQPFHEPDTLSWKENAEVLRQSLVRPRSLEREFCLGLHDLLVGRFRHSLLPGGVADLEAVAARIMKIELPPGEIALCAVFQLDDGNLLFVKRLASLHETFGAHRERMMHALFDRVFVLRFLPLA